MAQGTLELTADIMSAEMPTAIFHKNYESIAYNDFVGVWFEKANDWTLVIASWNVSMKKLMK